MKAIKNITLDYFCLCETKLKEKGGIDFYYCKKCKKTFHLIMEEVKHDKFLL